MCLNSIRAIRAIRVLKNNSYRVAIGNIHSLYISLDGRLTEFERVSNGCGRNNVLVDDTC